MIPDKLIWSKAQITSEQADGKTFPVGSLDFTAPGHQWIDMPNAGKLMVISPMVKTPRLQITGTGTKTAYQAEWTEQSARQALLDQLGLQVPIVTVPLATAPFPSAAPA
jgi:hypothetical protein